MKMRYLCALLAVLTVLLVGCVGYLPSDGPTPPSASTTAAGAPPVTREETRFREETAIPTGQESAATTASPVTLPPPVSDGFPNEVGDGHTKRY